MEDFIGGVSKIMQEIDRMEQNYSSDIQDVLNKVNAIISKCKEKENEKTPKPEKKKPKRVNTAFEKIEDVNANTMQKIINESHRLPKASKKKLLEKKQAPSNIKLKATVIKIDDLSDNDISDYEKSLNIKIKKEILKRSPQMRRVTRASSRNLNISKNSHNGSIESLSTNESVQLIPEEVSVVILSEEDEDTKGKAAKQKNIIPEQSEKRITRSSNKSLKKSSSQEKSNTSANTSTENPLCIDSNNNKDEQDKSKDTVYEDALAEAPKEADSISDRAKILGNVVGSETFSYPNNIPTNTTFVQPIIPDVPGESTFVINREFLSNEKENNQNIVPSVIEQTFILPENETQKVGTLNPNITTISKGVEPNQQNSAHVMSSKNLKQITPVVQKPKNTGAIPKQSSKENKDSGVNRKTPACAVLLKKSNSSSKLYKSPLTTTKPLSSKAPPRVGNNNQERKKAGNSVTNIKGKHQSPNLMQIQQEKEFLRRLEQKRLEIEAKDKQKLTKQIALEQQIKKSLQAIQEKKLQIAKNNQDGELKKEYNFNMLNSDDSTDDENYKSTKRSEPPLWSKRQARDMRIECQNFMPVKIIDSFFSVAPLNPDLREIFPEIHPRHLNRNSSIIWKTPPRYSQLPKY